MASVRLRRNNRRADVTSASRWILRSTSAASRREACVPSSSGHSRCDAAPDCRHLRRRTGRDGGGLSPRYRLAPQSICRMGRAGGGHRSRPGGTGEPRRGGSPDHRTHCRRRLAGRRHHRGESPCEGKTNRIAGQPWPTWRAPESPPERASRPLSSAASSENSNPNCTACSSTVWVALSDCRAGSRACEGSAGPCVEG